jgi:sorbitol-specific phosphotransferase system component IIBC
MRLAQVSPRARLHDHRDFMFAFTSTFIVIVMVTVTQDMVTQPLTSAASEVKTVQIIAMLIMGSAIPFSIKPARSST